MPPVSSLDASRARSHGWRYSERDGRDCCQSGPVELVCIALLVLIARFNSANDLGPSLSFLDVFLRTFLLGKQEMRSSHQSTLTQVIMSLDTEVTTAKQHFLPSASSPPLPFPFCLTYSVPAIQQTIPPPKTPRSPSPPHPTTPPKPLSLHRSHTTEPPPSTSGTDR